MNKKIINLKENEYFIVIMEVNIMVNLKIMKGMSKKHIKKENEVKLKNHFHINKIFL